VQLGAASSKFYKRFQTVSLKYKHIMTEDPERKREHHKKRRAISYETL
jgi:hypothetical protein